MSTLDGAIEGVLWRIKRIEEDRQWIRENDAVIGAELRRLRLERGISLRSLAATLDVSAPYLQDMEQGHRSVFSDTGRLERWVGIVQEATR